MGLRRRHGQRTGVTVNTDLQGHANHRIPMMEYVEKKWGTRWELLEGGEWVLLVRRQVTDETVLDEPDPKLYCHQCDL